jgi:hypothetical protein
MKTKKQKQTKKNTKQSRKKVKHYPVEYLGIALLALIVLETAMMGNITFADVTEASEILDLSGDVAMMGQLIVNTFQPMIDVAAGIDQFYQLAAAETEKLLDFTQAYEDTVAIVTGVHEFYVLASIEMEALLDPTADYMPQVAGASVASVGSCN